MTENKEKILELKKVRQYFSSGFGKRRVVVKAVHNISFDIYKGEVFGLVGESGCGKTTTGRAIIKLYNITDGDIYFKGHRISSGNRGKNLEIRRLKKEIDEKKQEINNLISELKGEEKKFDSEWVGKEIIEAEQELKDFIEEKNARINELLREKKISKRINRRNPGIMTSMQMIFQDPIDSLNPRMTVKEIVSEGLIINGIRDKKFIDKEVNRVLELVGLLPDHANRYPHEFSGGQRQRIGIARALIVNPELIIADEPISALDVSIQAQIINLLNDLRKNFDLTILFIAHNLSVVKFFCDRIAVMYYGRIVEIATSDELFKHPLHPYTKSLLSAVPLPDPDYEKTRQRISYNPSLRKFTADKPKMVEIYPGHFVYASQNEVKSYRKELNLE
ncbi:MAG: ATP-binding cassette domain-containing protein [Bacilli bacterium]|nr:ATP-binding cassette domain-containing protein [Bacilli bacterium]MDD4077731.1 ATP-binding cassette domain-containing protein [Bacilli bacterium]